MTVRPVPPGFHTVTPYLAVHCATELLAFTQAAFGAEPSEVVRDGEGRVRHAQVRIGDSIVMLGEVPADQTPYPATLYLYVEDVDAWFRRAVEAGGAVLEEPEDKFYGDRTAAVQDAQGNRWYMATHVEDVPEDELRRRAAQG